MSILNSKSSQIKHDIIGENSFFKGSIETKSVIQIDGKYIGESIKAEKIIISKTGIVESDVFANSIIIEGVLIGNIKQSDRVIVNKNGKLLGNVISKEMITTDGVMLKGSFKISPSHESNIEEEIKRLSHDKQHNTNFPFNQNKEKKHQKPSNSDNRNNSQKNYQNINLTKLN